MRKKTMLAAVLAAFTMGTQAQVIESFQVRDAATLHAPVLADSINTEGRKYDTRNLLSTAVGLNQESFNTQVMTADTAGFVALTKTEGEHLIYVVSTQIRADRFFRGKLRVTSPNRWEAYVNGASRMRKDGAEDSLDMRSSRDVALRLEPERNCEITIKMFVHKDDKAVPTFKCEVLKDRGYEEVNVFCADFDIAES
jgi:hypothetical protein